MVKKSYGVYWVGFSFDYSTYRSAASRIDRVYSPISSCGGGTCSIGQPTIINQVASSTTPARAETTYTFTPVGGTGSFSGAVGITVGNDGGYGGAIPY
ncbi:hypothetical protein SAMN00017477_0109 [Peptoniphilus asaccharolyticus DSM 20463]|uniref:Uncharacterized protein n=1 Tax=Peptoniphilus asaccharolyticus DSM 20463 TaxID=573058 RepID=A0A1W1UCX5_PEPAS|nr:hypothetical protein [Peptoniphilus asaccharolyticus]MBL7576454.1 hypothetical protein [Peptoniphilus asaccharolyticus]SMB78862.1 hypothetical protein SAMN00017477_0109 [Peptoniphilus asaccharolyticus DSM 20463]